MADDLLKQSVQFLPGVGPKRAALLSEELGIVTWEDLIYHFPFRYIDRSLLHTIAAIHPNMPYVQLKGEITGFKLSGPPRNQRLNAVFTDGTGTIDLVWFKGVRWITDTYKIGVQYLLFGKPALFNGRISIAHPDIEPAMKREQGLQQALDPVYTTTEKLKDGMISSRTLQKLIYQVLQQIQQQIPETLPPAMITKLNLMTRAQALLNIHFPKDVELLRKAEYRLKFEELFYIQLNILRLQTNRKTTFKGHRFPVVGDLFNTFYKNNLTFELTAAQKRVIKEIRADMNTGIQMNRLLQGDVGSGKTMVALMSMLIALDNGYQACLMAPTEILAMQHYATLIRFLHGLPVELLLLTGSTKKKARELLQQKLSSNEKCILIGTHALIEDSVQFSSLGLVVIDEQHRFGVAQRAKLWKKNPDHPPHILVMTATPIPRTLAMTLYGDLDVSVIDELPPGRKPIKTQVLFEAKRLRMIGFLKQQIGQGRQIYIVYPLIQESEKMDYMNLEAGYEAISREFPLPGYVVEIVHGRMKPADKDFAMERFKSGKAHILVSTTVIEVGVDIPNATVMVIESAERFGLSQLHQLRGRVGRGGNQSYCILMAGNKLSEEARSRLSTMVKTNNGFEIAEADLQLRGPGDIEGTQQSGIPFDLKIANLAKDGQLLQFARKIAGSILADDPQLSKPENKLLSLQIINTARNRFDWSMIS